MNLRDLRYLVAIDDFRHFGRAAEACHVSQPTLSGQVRKLEDELRLPVFERTAKAVVPTQAGRQLIAHARLALEQVEAMERIARALGDPLAGPLHLGIIPTLCPYLIPPVLPALGAACPRLAPVIAEEPTAVLLDRLRRNDLDLALIATPTEADEFHGVSLFDEPFWAALPGNHPLAGLPRLSMDDLGDTDLLVLSELHCLRDQVLALCAGRRTAAFGDLRATSLETLLILAGSGYGYTLVPGLAVPRLASAGWGIVLRPLADAGARRTIRLVSRHSFTRPAVVQALARVVEDAVRPLLQALRDGAPDPIAL